MAQGHFDERFEAATGTAPFPWQRALFERLVSREIPVRCEIPTGLGKTSILAIWLLALATRVERSAAALPRRLVYVVNRRTVVDQATREAERLCAPTALADPRLADVWKAIRSMRIQNARNLAHLEAPLAISTLRGQFADNGSWRADPCRPAIIIGTVDMIGSRLLFSGYGRGFKTKPLHAGFLGQDALVVHDEAHLEPAFQAVLETLEDEQHRAVGTKRDGLGRLYAMELTATPRAGRNPTGGRAPLVLSSADRSHAVAGQRLSAKKRIAFHPCEEKQIATRMAALAVGHATSGQAILVFVRKVDDALKIAKRLPSDRWCFLTGTIRGLERDRLKDSPIFARFDPKSTVPVEARTAGTVWLVCTSAGEVGIDMSADHVVCDLTPFDSMAQRFGRVNRFGIDESHVARVDVVHPADVAASEKPFDVARARTLTVLNELPLVNGRRDGSPKALGELPAAQRLEAFSPIPRLLPVTEVLLDAWSLTSITKELPGRPPVADWLHGIADWEAPETRLAWREEVEVGAVPPLHEPEALLELYPLKPHELLRDTTTRVCAELKKMVQRAPETSVWLVSDEGAVEVAGLASLLEKAERLQRKIVLLPPSVGGLTAAGSLDGDEPRFAAGMYDVADRWLNQSGSPRRVRIEVAPEGETDEQRRQHAGMRLVLTLVRAGGEASGDDADAPSWRWYVDPVSSDEQGSRTAPTEQTLRFHLASAEHFAREIVRALRLDEVEASAIVCAARFHDLGKTRTLWQRSIGNFDPERVLAKSNGARVRSGLTRYRHELGSLFDIEREPDFARLDDEAKELARHVIAAHHGRARPGFFPNEIFDPTNTDAACTALVREVPRRFARLQRVYGRWGLAYLESLLRAADVLASLALEATALSAPSEPAAAE